MMNLLFGPGAELEIALDGLEGRQKADVKLDSGLNETFPVYYDGETVSGTVNIKLKHKLEHYGIRVELFGVIEHFSDRSSRYYFLSMARELARPGALAQSCSFGFEFVSVEKPYESYWGVNVKLRYFIRVTVSKRLSDLVKEQDFVVHTLAQYPDSLGGIKMEVGIEDCLHIEFEYNKSKYHLKDAIVGKIYFLLVRIKVKHMELQILRRELIGSGPAGLSDCEVVAKFELMDGAPVKGETIPIRVFLSGYELGPTMRDVSKRFSVRYFLNLVLVDEEDRRYFKQQEVMLYRRPNRSRRPPVAAAAPGGHRQRRMMEPGFFHHRTPQLRDGGNGSTAAASATAAGEQQGRHQADASNSASSSSCSDEAADGDGR